MDREEPTVPGTTTPRRTTQRRVVACAGALVVALAAALSPVAPGSSASASPAARGADDLYLVTLRGPGTASVSSLLPRSVRANALLREQDEVLDALDDPEPVYRWTTALNGFAVRLGAEQVAVLEAQPQVLDVEVDTVRPLAAAPAAGRARTAVSAAAPAAGPQRGGGGTVVGVVDSGLGPDSPVFAQRSSSGRPTGFEGECETGPDWDAADCTGKVVGARSYVEGFGTDALRAASTVSPRDSDGHGTRTASIAVGNAGVPVTVDGERLGRFGGQAPDARVAVYKACWSAPDPRDDGCSTADLVTAVDDATRDGVDVLTLAVGGPAGLDVLERALLGATEGGAVVVAASGNEGTGSPAHTSPWVVTVGGTAGDVSRGRVVLPGGRRLAGAMLSRRTVARNRVVLAEDAAAAGSATSDARVCAPGSLDAAVVADAVVVCERGRVARVDKSRAVALADGAAMVLLNRGRGTVDADVHSVPTVHLAAGPARALERWLDRARAPRVALRPGGTVERRARVATFSGSGDAGTGVAEPDVVAPASSVLAAVPDDLGAWDVTSGTSVATARVAGIAATLLGRGFEPAEVRSALVTTARPLRRTAVLRGGGGLVRAREARRPGLAYLVEPDGYRAWLDAGRARLNTPSVLLTGGDRAARRRITNVSGRRLYFSSAATGFRRDVEVTPAAVRLGPGESAVFRVRVSPGGAGRLDDGHVVWRGATGTVTRIPVVLAR